MERYMISRSSRQRVLERAERLLRQRQHYHHTTDTNDDGPNVTKGNQEDDQNKNTLHASGNAVNNQSGLIERPDGQVERSKKPHSSIKTQTNQSDFYKRTSSKGTQIPATKPSVGAARDRRKSSSDSGLGSGWSKMCDESWMLPSGHQLAPNSDRFLAPPPSSTSVNENSVSSQIIALSSYMGSNNQKESQSGHTSDKEEEEEVGGEGGQEVEVGEDEEAALEHDTRDKEDEDIAAPVAEDNIAEKMENGEEDDVDSLLMSEVDSLAEQSLQQAKLERIRESVDARRRLSDANSLQQASYRTNNNDNSPQQVSSRMNNSDHSVQQPSYRTRNEDSQHQPSFRISNDDSQPQPSYRISNANNSLYQPAYRMLPIRQDRMPRSHIPVLLRNGNISKKQDSPVVIEMNHSTESKGWSQDDMAQLNYKLNHIEHAATLKGKLVTFFKNRDPHFKGMKVSISIKQFPKLETLCNWLDNKIYTPKGIRHIFLLPSGEEVSTISDFQNGRSYVVSSTKSVDKVSYGNSKENFWSNRPPTAGRYRKGDTSLALQDVKVRKAHSYPASSRASSTMNSMPQYGHPSVRKQWEGLPQKDYSTRGVLLPNDTKPKVLTIISNTHRDSQEKVILNPKTTQSFEEIMQDVTSMLQMAYPPVTALWTARKPNRKVNSFSHLFKLLKQHDTYLAVGKENQPFEIDQRETNGFPVDDAPGVKKPVKAKQRKPYNSLPQKTKAVTSEDTYDLVSSNGADETELEPAISPEFATYTQRGPYQYPPRIPRHGKQEPYQVKQERYGPVTSNGVDGNINQIPAYPQRKTNTKQYPPKPRHQYPQSKLPEDPRIVSVTPPPDSEGPAIPKKIPPQKVPYRRPYEERDCVKVDIHGFSRTFYAPRYGQHEPDGGKPHKKLKLDWVYGYRGRDSRNNLVVLPSGELLYFVATVVIMYDPISDQQRHYREHTEDVTCITLHPEPNRPRVASGQTAGHNTENVAHIRVWDPFTLVTYSVVGAGIFTNAVTSIGFSTVTSGLEMGALLMAVDESDKHVLSVWDWQHDHLLAKTHTSEDTVVWGQFHPLDHTTLVTYGKNHVFFWKLFWDPHTDSVGKLYRDKKSGLYEGDYMPKFVTSMAFSSSGDVITGDSNGRIVVWQSDHQNAFVYNQTLSEPMTSAHQKSVFSLHMLDDGTLISGGDNHLRLWDSLNGYRFVRETEVPAEFGTVRSLVPVKSGIIDSGLFVGTTQNCILSGNVHENFKTIVQGHLNECPDLCPLPKGGEFISCGTDLWVRKWAMAEHQLVWAVQVEGPYNELWALVTHPDDYTFVSAGVDQRVRKWDVLNHTVLWDMSVEKPCLSLDLDPTGSVVALGTTSGRFIVLRGQDGQHIFSMQAGNAQLGVVKFSPEGDYIALGSHDSSIYIYEVQDEGHVFRRHGTGILRGHKNFVTHMDWSANGKYLRSVSGDYDLLFWSVEEMREVVAQSVRDEVWYSETVVLSYNHLGAWSNLLEGEDINTTDLAHKKDVLAVGENLGSLKLYKYPCTSERPHYCEQKQYTGHVTKVAFSFDDHFLISSGGKDAAILQWTVVKNTHR